MSAAMSRGSGAESSEQTVIVPDDYRLFLELPRTIPSGVAAQVKINIPTQAELSARTNSFKIEEIRRLLQHEMAINETSTVAASSGDGWETYIKERYGEP